MPKLSPARERFEKELAVLVARFDNKRDEYLRSDYNEAQVRLHFIDPFFEALGWDVRDNAGKGRAAEVLVARGETLGIPDYTFRIDGKTLFYVEAKAPHVSLERSSAALQAKKYAWNTPEPFVYFAAATDFEEFRFYDASQKPDPKHPHVGLIFSYRYPEYLTPKALDDLWQLSREAVAAGSLAKLLKPSARSARQRSPLDQVFLSDLTLWREKLAKSIFKAHPELTDPADLNNLVQIFLDRLIFMRVAEDRGVLDAGRLVKLARAWIDGDPDRSIMAELLLYFRDVNERLNGEIFKKHKCEELRWDSALVAEIILEGLEPYDFNKIGVELLGSIYERYLGKTIRVTATRAVVEDKPEVRKAGGVYYTPKYIVDYIVEQTVGKLIEGKSPAQIAKLKILDPACGSSSFLIGAYQKLLDYHAAYYAQRASRRGGGGAPSHQARLLQEPRAEYGDVKLSLAEKATILRNNIFGVDIDPQAVEITMMSLYIKMLEGERGAMMGQGVLPRLNENIKCGNSLIAHDIGALSEDDNARINPFDWNSKGEGFGEIMAAGGFDAVIGNPPYGAEFFDVDRLYLQGKFKDESKSYDSYELFLLTASHLIRKDGRISMIIPASWLTGEKYEMSRRRLTTELNPSVAYAMPFDIFKDAYIDTAIVVFTSAPISNCLIHLFPKRERLSEIPDGIGKKVSIKEIRDDAQNRLSVALAQDSASMLRKVSASQSTLGDWFDISRGVQPYSRSKHTEEQIENRFLHSATRRSKQHLPELQGNELARYWIDPERKSYLKYSDEIASTRPMRMFEGKRIVLRRLLTRKFRLQASLATETLITTDNVLNVIPRANDASIEFALGVVNSRLVSWMYVNTSMVAQKDDFPQVHISALSAIHLPDADKSRHEKMVALVERMLELHKQKQATKSDTARERLQRTINVTDEQIDALVYELYGLTKDEIKIVEESAR